MFDETIHDRIAAARAATERVDEKARARLDRDQKLHVRERIRLLYDEGTFVEDGRLANATVDGLPADGVITGQGLVDGRPALVMANDPTVKAGSWGARTVEKIVRLTEKALSTDLPIFWFVDSAGARLTDQVQLFPGRRGAGRIFHNQVMQNSPPFKEVVVDGFESFEFSQYYPIHHHVAVEKGTDFFIYFTDSELRRKGRMTEHQKRRRKELELKFGRPDPKAIEKDMRQTLEVVLKGRPAARVFSDDHPAYRRSIKTMTTVIDHRVTPGSAHRDKNNSLWEVNLLDLMIRHSNANHRRETIAWSKRRQGSAERLAILLVWRNYMKGRREKVRGSPTPAMERGMMDRPLEIEELLARRIFRTRCKLPPRWSEYYERKVTTRALNENRRHDLKMAF